MKLIQTRIGLGSMAFLTTVLVGTFLLIRSIEQTAVIAAEGEKPPLKDEGAARGPKPVPDIDVPPGFRRLPNGEVVRPEEEGVSLQPEPIAFGMTGELEKQYRRVVEEDATSRSVLGRRLAYIYAETIEPPKGKKRDSINVKLWYFSYTANTAVAVTLKNGVVQKAEKTEYWPPEGREEVEAAVALARSHPALQGKVNDLEGGAILAQAERDRAPWLGNRVLDVRFFTADRVSKYMALVDLTTEKVLRAGHAHE